MVAAAATEGEMLPELSVTHVEAGSGVAACWSGVTMWRGQAECAACLGCVWLREAELRLGLGIDRRGGGGGCMRPSIVPA